MLLNKTSFADEAMKGLAMHGLLTIDQLRRLVPDAPTPQVARQAMSRLKNHGLAESVQAGSTRAKTWLLTDDGLEAMRPLVGEPCRASVKMARSSMRRHLWATNEVGLAAIEVAGPSQVSWVHEEALPHGSARSVRPDSILTVTIVEQRQLHFGQWFVELDRGTEPVAVLANKIANYLAHHNYCPQATQRNPNPAPHWQERFTAWPTIMFVFDCDNYERRITALSTLIANDHRLVRHMDKVPVIAAPLHSLATSMRESYGFTSLPTMDPTSWM